MQVQASAEMRLMVFSQTSVVERVQLQGAPGNVRLWLKNGYGIDLTRMENETVLLAVIRRQLNEPFKLVFDSPVTPDKSGHIGDVSTQGILDALLLLNELPPFMHRDFRLNTVGQIMTWAARSCNPFFTDDNTRHTAQTLARTAYNSFGPSGAFFVTGTIVTAGERRRYTVRRAWFGTKFDPINNGPVPHLEIGNASGFQEFLTPQAALNDAKARAQKERDRYKFLPDAPSTSPFSHAAL